MASLPASLSSSMQWLQVSPRGPRICARRRPLVRSTQLTSQMKSPHVMWTPLATSMRYPRVQTAVICLAGMSANQPPAGVPDPYEVLGVNPIQKFDIVKAAFDRKFKDAEKKGDEGAMALLEGAYDQIMMKQLSNRKQGISFGSFKVSREIRHADRQPLFPWGPRFAKSSTREIAFNFAVSVFFAIWAVFDQTADWRPLQFLIFGYMFSVFYKLQPSETDSSFTEDGTQRVDMEKKGRRLLRTLALVFCPVSIAAMAFTGTLNVFDLLGQNIPRTLLNSQKLFITVVSAVILFVTGSFYR